MSSSRPKILTLGTNVRACCAVFMYLWHAPGGGWMARAIFCHAHEPSLHGGFGLPDGVQHKAKNIRTSVHGDDFTSCGPKTSLDWLEQAIGEKYEIMVGPRLGPRPNIAKKGRAINRITRWCDRYIEYEVDCWQIKRLITDGL